jgi:hypothetical protein
MKKSLSLLLLIAFLAFGCESKTQESSTNADSNATEGSVLADPPVEESGDRVDLNGFYVGNFEATKFQKGKNPSFTNLINIAIDALGDGKVVGHSVVAGNIRPFNGTYTMEGDAYKVEAAEPGDDQYDGKFSFVLNPSSQDIIGTWVANNAKLAVSERKYDLKRRAFAYDPDLELPGDVAWADLYSKVPDPEWMRSEITTEDVLLHNASKERLKKEDVAKMYKSDLEILRNSIYARHGYSFKTRKMRYVFDSSVPWYMPVSTDVSKELTEIETENIALLKRYEQHAETYYDSFGR